MSSLAIHSALVLDDKAEDAYAAVHALSRLGIGAILSRGRSRDTPRVSGIRLVILDFSLLAGLSTEDSVSDTQQRLSEKLADKNGPFVILGWTKMDPNEARRFIDQYNETSNVHSYIFNNVLRKEEFETTRGYDIRKLSRAIRNALQFTSPLDFLFDWEKCIINAASSTVNSIGRIASLGIDFKENIGRRDDPDREVWRVSLRHLFQNLSKMIHGDSSTNGELVIQSICEVLDPVLLDRVESETTELGRVHGSMAENLLDLGRNAPGKMRAMMQSEILGFHHASSSVEHYSRPRPSDVYDYERMMLKLKPKGCKKQDFLAHSSDTDLHMTFFPGLEGDYKEILAQEGKRILLDITPLCDYQKRLSQEITTSRFVVGIIAPAREHTGYKNTGANIRIGPLRNPRIPSLESDCYLLFNYFRIVTLRLDVNKIYPTPLFRIGGHLLSRIQTLFGAHALRQGILE